jgi:putative restriction endonuclease
MIKLYVGVTDYDWFRFLSARPDIGSVNFWQPGGQTQFKALQQGELFLFKLHAPRNFLVGGGVFAHASILPVSLAWEAFGAGNGASSLEEMRHRIGFYRRKRREQVDPRLDYRIGCRILEQPFFLREEEWIAVPASWAPNIVSGRGYDTADEDGSRLWAATAERLPAQPFAGLAEPRYGEPTLIRPRLGQGTFRVAVTDFYGRRCAVTGERTLPILDAAHIRPFAEGGAHEVTNGLLLRTDVHRLFDLGYVTVSDDGRFEVGRRLKDDFANGRLYYAMHGQSVALPADPRHRPAPEALRWHQEKRFLG